MVATRNDVARLAGVSAVTVSRVYNNPDSVSEKLVAKVRAAAEKLEYLPNRYASALKRKGGNTIVFVEDANSWLENHGVLRMFSFQWAESIKTAYRFLEETTYDMSLRSCKDTREFARMIEMRHAEIAGIVFCFTCDIEWVELTIAADIPYICCGFPSADRNGIKWPDYFNQCTYNHYQASLLLGEMFRDTGHESVALVRYRPPERDIHPERVSGFSSGFGGKVEEILISEWDTQSLLVTSPLAQRIKRGDFDGVFCIESTFALRVYYGLVAGSCKIPDDVSFCVYDLFPIFDGMPVIPVALDTHYGDIFRIGLASLIKMINNNERRVALMELVPEVRRGQSIIKRG